MNPRSLESQLISEFEGDIESELAFDEGERAMPYPDTRGILTIGFGHNLEASPLPSGWKPPLTYFQQVELLRDDILTAERELVARFPWVAGLPEDARKGVLVDLAFNMGVAKLSKFTHFLGFFERGHFWQDAANALRNSDYGRELPKRSNRLAIQLVDNRWAIEPDFA